MLSAENYIINDETKNTLSKMIDLFTVRIDSYEERILTDGGQEGYRKLAELVPSSIE
jgi:hypothetical protein